MQSPLSRFPRIDHGRQPAPALLSVAPQSGKRARVAEDPPPSTATPPPRKLLDRVRWHLRVKRYSIRTEQAYIDWIRRFILFHKKRHPDQMGEEKLPLSLATWRLIALSLPPHRTRPSALCCSFTSRSLIANSIHYRRRAGSPPC